MIDFTLAPERAEHASAIDALHQSAFGPGRFVRAAFRLREQGPHDCARSFVALDRKGELAGSVRMTAVRTARSGHCGFLLGPLAVDSSRKNGGIGRALVRRALDAAAETDAAFVVLVGDAPYYAPLGFVAAPAALALPGPVLPRRLLVRVLKSTDAAALEGVVRFDAEGASRG